VKQAITIDNLTFSYPNKPLFNGLSLRIAAGEFVAIIGANGSGKTTLLQLLSGMLKPERGTIAIDGVAVHGGEHDGMIIARTLLSVVLQNPENQFVGATVEEDIAFGLENKRKSKREMDDIIACVSETMQLTELLQKAPHELSGGQKQRVALASSLAMETKYLLLDEATSQLDPQGKQEVLRAVQALAQTKERTVVMITHDLTEVLLAERVIVLHEGQVVIDTTPKKLFSQHQDKLADYHLVLPRVIGFSAAFQQAGLLRKPAFSIEELVGELCK
jgi:energy-coupling factor transport system ATP-binding protein